MNKKHTFTEETKQIGSITFRRIKALRSFGGIKEGDLGGWIEKEENLSHEGNCWIYGNARVSEDASVSGNASVSGDARVYGNASVSEDAWVSGNARVSRNASVSRDASVYGNASISESARVSENARVSGNARVFGDARVFGNAKVFGDARVFGNAKVSGDASVFGDARVFGNANVSGYARVSGDANVSENALIYENHWIQYGNTTTDLSKDLKSLIQNSCNLGVNHDDTIIAYKMVVKREDGTLVSEYDPNFVYKVGEYAEVKDPDLSNESCSSGIHVSGFHYWTHQTTKCNAYLTVKVLLKDVITCQDGKIRCKKIQVL